MADEAAERFIEARVRARFGDVLFVGEEIYERDKSILDRLPEVERAIVIDPIDGTFNYANGIPAFAVIAAVVEKGETVAGILYDPMRDDWTSAIKGEGAYLEGPGKPRRAVRVASPRPLHEMHGAVSWAYAEEPERSRMLAGMGKFWGCYQYRCGGQEMKMIVEGGGHFAVYSKLALGLRRERLDPPGGRWLLGPLRRQRLPARTPRRRPPPGAGRSHVASDPGHAARMTQGAFAGVRALPS